MIKLNVHKIQSPNGCSQGNNVRDEFVNLESLLFNNTNMLSANEEGVVWEKEERVINF